MSVLQEKMMQKHRFLALFLTSPSEFRCQGTCKLSSTERWQKPRRAWSNHSALRPPLQALLPTPCLTHTSPTWCSTRGLLTLLTRAENYPLSRSQHLPALQLARCNSKPPTSRGFQTHWTASFYHLFTKIQINNYYLCSMSSAVRDTSSSVPPASLQD